MANDDIQRRKQAYNFLQTLKSNSGSAIFNNPRSYTSQIDNLKSIPEFGKYHSQIISENDPNNETKIREFLDRCLKDRDTITRLADSFKSPLPNKLGTPPNQEEEISSSANKDTSNSSKDVGSNVKIPSSGEELIRSVEGEASKEGGQELNEEAKKTQPEVGNQEGESNTKETSEPNTGKINFGLVDSKGQPISSVGVHLPPPTPTGLVNPQGNPIQALPTPPLQPEIEVPNISQSTFEQPENARINFPSPVRVISETMRSSPVKNLGSRATIEGQGITSKVMDNTVGRLLGSRINPRSIGGGLAKRVAANLGRQAALTAARAALLSPTTWGAGAVIAAIVIVIIIVGFVLTQFEDLEKSSAILLVDEVGESFPFCSAGDIDSYRQRYGFYEPDSSGHHYASPLDPNYAFAFDQVRQKAVAWSSLHQVDPIMVAWWAFFETGGKRDSYSWSNCGGTNYDVNINCNATSSGSWQLGYGQQYADTLGALDNAFEAIYGPPTDAAKTRQVGQNVLDKAGQNMTFPDKSLQQLLDESSTYWLSVLMRDPDISVYLVASVLKYDINRSNADFREVAFSWSSYYRTNWQAATNLLDEILRGWGGTSTCTISGAPPQGPLPSGTFTGDICPIASRNIICSSFYDDRPFSCKHCGAGYPDDAMQYCVYVGTRYAIDIAGGKGETVSLPTVAGHSILWTLRTEEPKARGLEVIIKYTGVDEETGEQYFLQFHHAQPGSGNSGTHRSGELGGQICAYNSATECDHTHVQIAIGGNFPGQTGGSQWLDAAAYMCR